MVDGVLASCYAVADHNIVHFGMAPLRWFPGMMNWMFGTKSEIHSFVEMGLHLIEWAYPNSA